MRTHHFHHSNYRFTINQYIQSKLFAELDHQCEKNSINLLFLVNLEIYVSPTTSFCQLLRNMETHICTVICDKCQRTCNNNDIFVKSLRGKRHGRSFSLYHNLLQLPQQMSNNEDGNKRMYHAIVSSQLN